MTNRTPIQHVATRPIPYGRQSISEEDIQAVVDVLRSSHVTTGPALERFERTLAAATETATAVAVSSGTAALHCAMAAIGVGAEDEVIVPAITFAATANCVAYQSATPRFADVEPDTLLIDPASVASRITPRTKAIVAVDYAGHPCDYSALRDLAQRHQLKLLADACHGLGAAFEGRPVGSLADLSAFSFHPVKAITAGEGGAVTTDRDDWAQAMRRFRNHGIRTDYQERDRLRTWQYEVAEAGFNYRLSDIQAALATSQLARLEQFIERRHRIAEIYDRFFDGLPGVAPLRTRPNVRHARHLYVIRIDADTANVDRETVFQHLRQRGVHTAVHYRPVYLHPYYRRRYGTAPGLCPGAEAAFQRILSLPIFPAMSDDEVAHVVSALEEVFRP